jgi:hypothetical protein
MKLTPWFDGSVKPVRPGVYERAFGPDAPPRYAEWTGWQWLESRGTVRSAPRSLKVSATQSAAGWRGLAEEPKP